jgi:hypothetical protein
VVGAGDPGIVDQDVDPAERGVGGVARRLDRFEVGDVDRGAMDLALASSSTLTHVQQGNPCPGT